MSIWDSDKSTVFLCHQQFARTLDFAILRVQTPLQAHNNVAVNTLLNNKLQNLLHRSGLIYRPVFGASPDLRVQEKCWMVRCDKAHAIALAHTFTQDSLFWVEKDKLFWVPLQPQHEEEYLGLFHTRTRLLPA